MQTMLKEGERVTPKMYLEFLRDCTLELLTAGDLAFIDVEGRTGMAHLNRVGLGENESLELAGVVFGLKDGMGRRECTYENTFLQNTTTAGTTEFRLVSVINCPREAFLEFLEEGVAIAGPWSVYDVDRQRFYTTSWMNSVRDRLYSAANSGDLDELASLARLDAYPLDAAMVARNMRDASVEALTVVFVCIRGLAGFVYEYEPRTLLPFAGMPNALSALVRAKTEKMLPLIENFWTYWDFLKHENYAAEYNEAECLYRELLAACI